eukprot:6474775-Lingulodinium_polyedra.AAC.1
MPSPASKAPRRRRSGSTWGAGALRRFYALLAAVSGATPKEAVLRNVSQNGVLPAVSGGASGVFMRGRLGRLCGAIWTQ